MKNGLRFLGIDRAVFFSNAAQVIRLITGPITMVLVLRYLTPEIQGYFYTFSGIVAMQVFLEMGFSQNILQFASHEFSKLHFTPQKTLDGDPIALSRIISLGRLAFCYYTVAALLMASLIGIGGHLFFSLSDSHGIHWQGAWWMIAVTASLTLAVNPVWSLLEGCNRVAEIAQFRLYSSIIIFLASVVAFVSGAGIYIPAITSLSSLLISILYIFFFWKSFLLQFTNPPQHGRISWFREIWPFQWRIAVSWMSGYFIFSVVNPIVFYFCGAANAGRFGMTFQIVRMIAGVATPWISTKAPTYGMLIASKQWEKIETLWRRNSIQSVSITALGIIALLAAIPIASNFFPHLPNRLASMQATAWLGLAIVVQQIVYAMAILLRANKQEPYMGTSIVGAILTVALISLFAPRWGVDGVSVGYSLTAIIMFFPAFWIYRRKWQEYKSAEVAAAIVANP